MQVNGIDIRVSDGGSGTPVVLLHGFPDSSHLWRHQVPMLTAAGMRCIVPDLRGFGLSEKPTDPSFYAAPYAISDVLAILDSLGIERAHVVGHDWGAVVAWGVAAFAPERVSRLVAMSVGHPEVFRTPSIEQRRLSWYMLFFQFEEAEGWLMANDWQLLRDWCAGGGDVDRYIQDLSRPGALAAALGWYRANVHPIPPGAQLPVPPVSCPTLGIWSDGDAFLTEAQMTASAQHVTGEWRYERIDGASHWVPLDATERVNELLISFLSTPA